jgi:UDP-N-acetyl-D-mannosaminuronic acid transferase (WecB/TagA/CpsF family)
MDVMAASENGVWLYDQLLQPSRWLKMHCVKLGEMNTASGWLTGR